MPIIFYSEMTQWPASKQGGEGEANDTKILPCFPPSFVIEQKE